MTGRDLVLYILNNNLEDRPIFENGHLLGFLSLDETAVRLNVGIASVYVWIQQERLRYICVGDRVFVPITDVLTLEETRGEVE